MSLLPKTSNTSKSGVKRRSYDDEALHAMKKHDKGTPEKIQVPYLTESLDLYPISIRDERGHEDNALANKEIAQSLSTKHENIHDITPYQSEYFCDPVNEQKRRIKCLPAIAAFLEHLMNTSPYSNILIQRNYVRLEDDIGDLMNEGLQVIPQIVYFTARILAGTEVMNTVEPGY